MSESIEHILSELDLHLENLKGDYLIQIIKKIRKLGNKIQSCSTSEYCTVTRDFSSNHMLTVTQEVMKTFATLLKQLQGTQKQVIKL